MRILFFLLFFIFLYADNLTSILSKIDKNSPDYSYAKILIYKIDTLKTSNPKCKCDDIKNQDEYVDKFLLLAKYRKRINDISENIKQINLKIAVLDNTPISILQKKFYEKEKKSLLDERNYIQNNINKWEKKLFEQLDLIHFNIVVANKNIDYLNTLLMKNQKKLESFKLQLQKWQLLNNKKNIELYNTYIKNSIKEQKAIYQSILKNKLIIWFYKLKNRDKSVFKFDLNINLDIKDSLEKELIIFEKFAFGDKYYLYNSQKEIINIFESIVSIINYPIFKINEKEITLIDLMIFILILIVGMFISKYYKKTIYRLKVNYAINHSTATLLANMGYYFIITIAFLIALKSIGLDLSSFAIVAGALSVGIGFGLQNVVSNFISGIIMMFEKTIKVGDYIQIDENTRGEVIDIFMRSTLIKTNDNINLIIPNQKFLENNVINWTMNDDIVRFRIPFGVAYGTNIDKMEEIILKALKNSDLPFIRSKNEDLQPRVIFTEMGDSSLNFELFIWVKGKFARMPRRTRSKFLKLIYNTLNEAGISIPFPQQDLHIKDSIPFEIKIKKD